MHLNGDNIEKILDEVYVVHNFLSEEELAEVFEELNLVDWNIDTMYHYRDAKSLRKFEDRLTKILDDDTLSFPPFDNVIRRYPTQGMDPHVDRQNYQNLLFEIIVDENFEGEKVENGLMWYAFILYLNDDFTGGEICYPEFGVEYKPKVGDLVIHETSIVHAVNKVKEGYRYTHSSGANKKVYFNKKLYEAIPTPNSREYRGVLLNYSADHARKSGEPSWNKRLRDYMLDYVYNPETY